ASVPDVPRTLRLVQLRRLLLQHVQLRPDTSEVGRAVQVPGNVRRPFRRPVERFPRLLQRLVDAGGCGADLPPRRGALRQTLPELRPPQRFGQLFVEPFTDVPEPVARRPFRKLIDDVVEPTDGP